MSEFCQEHHLHSNSRRKERGKADVRGAQAEERRTRKEMERVGTTIIIQTAEDSLGQESYKLLKSILINDAAIKMSRALIDADGYSKDQPVSLICHILCLISVTLNNSTYDTLSHFTWRSSTGHVSQRPCWGWGRHTLSKTDIWIPPSLFSPPQYDNNRNT